MKTKEELKKEFFEKFDDMTKWSKPSEIWQFIEDNFVSRKDLDVVLQSINSDLEMAKKIGGAYARTGDKRKLKRLREIKKRYKFHNFYSTFLEEKYKLD